MTRFLLTLLALVMLTSCAIPVALVSPVPPETSPPSPIETVPPDQGVISPPMDTTPISSPAPNPYAPRPGDAALQRGNVYLESVDVFLLESFPVQVMLGLQGNLPDPCHELRVVINPPDANNRIMVEVYSVADSKKVCIQVITPFDVNIDLGSFASGHYTVWVNGEQRDEFDV